MDLADILIVEDEPIVALSIQNRLQGLGYRVTGVASSAAEALEHAQVGRPDLVLMDIRLKGGDDGITAAAEIKARHNLPVVFLTAYADDATIARARTVFPAGYILKPFETKELQTTIEIALNRHNLEKKLRESEERYELASRGANDGIWDWNLITNSVYYSHRWKAIIGAADLDITTDPEEWFSRVHPQDIDRVKRDLGRHIDGVTPFFENEHRILHKDGTFRWVSCRGMAVRDANGTAFRIAGSQSDVTRRRLAEDRLIQFAFFDPLTDLPNQVAFLDRLWSVVRQRRSAPSSQPAETMFTAMVELTGIPGV
ncbi:MAG: response regulator, partial [Spirochaetia bacterium]|nr:response regulator [Spirochaetia bacterium]